MWGFETTEWIRSAAREGVGRREVEDPVLPIKIPEGNATLWRYMDLAKLLSLVGNESLYFSSLVSLGDKFEGQWSRRTFEMIHNWDELWMREQDNRCFIEDKVKDQRLYFPKEHQQPLPQDTVDHLGRLIRDRKHQKQTFVSCWYQEDGESQAMWKLFAGEKYGVAVRTTASKLIGSFTNRLPDYLGFVKYLDYEKEPMAVSQFPPVFYKRKAFQHEREVRAVFATQPCIENPEEGIDSLGIEEAVNPTHLIDELIVSPYSPDWLIEVVELLVARFKVKVAVAKSTLGQAPPGKGAWATVRSLEAYFAFQDGDVTPLRIWALSREQARCVACERWTLEYSLDQSGLEVWSEGECDKGFSPQPEKYECVSNPYINDHQKGLDPENG